MCPRLKLRRIIARGLLLALVSTVLAACSAARLAYNQAPNLAYWWIDGHVDFSDVQSVQMRQDIDGFFAWHRATELPAYAARLSRWQTLVKQDSSAEQVCAEFDAVRSATLRLAERSVEPMARLALQLTPAQLEHLQRHQAKGNETFEKDFLRGSPAQRMEKRLERAVDRYETLYGPLTGAQLDMIQTGLRQSPFDPQRTQAERLRRQSDLQKTLRQMQAAAPAAAPDAVRAYVQRVLQSPSADHAAYSASQVRSGCAQFAALHNSTSPAQRAHAVGVLKGYEDDLRALIAAP
jgi:hypothetical protein